MEVHNGTQNNTVALIHDPEEGDVEAFFPQEGIAGNSERICNAMGKSGSCELV